MPASVAQSSAGTDPFRDIMVPMRDGVRLATDVFLPQSAGHGPWPAIMERTTYDKCAARANEYTRDHPQVFGRQQLARFFTDAGFAVVFQDCRGRYGSEGRFTKYRGEAEDGFDAIAWVAQQHWCDGQVATMGMSYSAHTQMAAACLNPPALAAMICDCGGFSNAYQGGIRFGGALEMKQVTWAFRHALRSRAAAADPAARAALEATDLRDWMQRLPWSAGQSPLTPVPDYERFLFEQWTNGTFDDYWKIPALYAAGWHETMRKVPSVHISGWYDPYAVTAVEKFTGLRAHGHDTALILGPWTHGNRSRTYAGNVSLRLFVSSDRPTTDFTAKLVDVYPPSVDYPHGYAMNLTDGILRSCNRKGFDRQAALAPDEVADLTVQLYPTANRFETGHRIRVEVSSSNFPRFDVNPNFAVGDDLSPVRCRALNTLLTGPDHPSCLIVDRLD